MKQDSEEREKVFTCEETGQEFTGVQVRFGGGWFPPHRFHPDVLDAQQEKEKQADRDAKAQARAHTLLTQYQNDCPAIMLETDLERLPRKGRETVMDWQHQPTGIILHGVTGKGKTRLMWAKVKQLSELGVGWQFWSARKLADTLSESWDKRQHEKIMVGLHRCPVLFLDDVGKERVTGRWETELFDMVNARTENARPTFISTNFQGGALVARYKDAEMAAALLRRLREFFQAVCLT